MKYLKKIVFFKKLPTVCILDLSKKYEPPALYFNRG